MTIVANTVVILVALLHIYFLVLEMFLWDKPAGLKAFGQSKKRQRPLKFLPQIKVCITDFWQPDCCWVSYRAILVPISSCSFYLV